MTRLMLRIHQELPNLYQLEIMELFVLGVNHKTTDVGLRSRFSLDEKQKSHLRQYKDESDLESLVILNTCNRTELYGQGDIEELTNRYLQINNLDNSFKKYLFVKTGEDALQHIFYVTSGLDSQIIGDLEILGQVKSAFAESKSYRCMGRHFERLANSALQAAKNVRNNTSLSSGTSSIAYAAVAYLKKNNLSDVNILLLGCGRFGTTVARNIKKYLPQSQLTVTNRTAQKAHRLAEELEVTTLPWSKVSSNIGKYKVIISAISNQKDYLINKSMLNSSSKQLFIDLSVPGAINRDIQEIPTTSLICLDEISQSLEKTKALRNSEIPIAQSIISIHTMEFMEWYKVHQYSHSIQYYRNELSFYASHCPHMQKLPEELVNKHMNISMAKFVGHIRKNNSLPDCQDKENILKLFLDANHLEKKNYLEELRLSIFN